jgi:diguanylate cyclase (GGDEF)-like protein
VAEERDMEMLEGIARGIAAASDASEALQAAADGLAALAGADRCSVFRLDDDSGELVALVDHREPAGPAEGRRLDAELWPEGHRAVLTRATVLAGAEPGADAEDAAAGADLVVPLLFRGRVVGVLEVGGCRAGRPLAAARRPIETAATLVAAVVADLRAQALLRRRETVDELTGLQNRRTFLARLEEALARAARYDTALSLLMVDVDDLSAFNAAYGRARGDDLLRALAALVKKTVRGNIDEVARYGGEEFVLLLPQTGAPGAVTAADRLQSSLVEEATRVAELLREATAKELADRAGGAEAMTISVGVAFYPRHGATAFDLLMAADRALYTAKQRGKNQVWVHEG